MAVQFHELPPEVFPEAAKPYIARLNRELRELFALEGVIRQPRAVNRSDNTIVRRDEVQVHISRVTPDISASVAGSSTVIGTPALVFGTVNAVGTTNTVISVNSRVALFDTTLPIGVSNTAAVGTASVAARRDHRHDHPVFSTGDLHTDLLPLSGVRDMTGELGTDVGTFRSDVASGGVAFTFNSSNSFAAGDLFRFDDNGSGMLAQSFEGHISTIRSELAPQTADLLHVRRALSGDNRTLFRGVNIQPSVAGTITGAIYTATHTGVNCAMTFNPTDMPTSGTKTINAGVFSAAINGGSTKTVATVRGGLFSVTDSGASMPVTNAYAGHFQFSGSFAGVLTNAYGARVDSIGAGTNRWGVWSSNKVHCDASDFIANTNAKGYITKDSQGTARFWRMYTDATSGTTGGVTIAIDAAGTITATRVAGATGTINFTIGDVGTSAPLT